MAIGNIGNSKFIGENRNMLYHLNAILRRINFLCILIRFFLNGIQDNHWIGPSVMKPVDDVVFQKIKLMGEGNNDENNNFDIDILDEGALDKTLTVTDKTLDEENPWKTIYEVIDDE